MVVKKWNRGNSLKLLEGDEIYTCSMVMRQGIVDKFRLLSGDNNMLHTDESYACKKGYSGRVVYGNMLGVMLSYFVGEKLKDQEIMLLSQSIEYRYPVYINDEISMESKVVFTNVVYGIVEFKVKYRNQVDKLVATGKFSVKYITH